MKGSIVAVEDFVQVAYFEFRAMVFDQAGKAALVRAALAARDEIIHFVSFQGCRFNPGVLDFRYRFERNIFMAMSRFLTWLRWPGRQDYAVGRLR